MTSTSKPRWARYKGDKRATRAARTRSIPKRVVIADLQRDDDGKPWCPTHGAGQVVINSAGDTWQCTVCGLELGKVPKADRDTAPRHPRALPQRQAKEIG